MTYLRQYMDGARSAALARARIRKTGYVCGYGKVWSHREEQVCRLFWPKTYEISRLLRGRSVGAVQAKCRQLGLTPKAHPWTAAELSKLKRIYPASSWEEIYAALPGRSLNSIRHAVQYYKIRRNRKPYKPTGNFLIDQIRSRCFDLNYRMHDADKLALSKRYFYKAGWHSGWINHKAIARAVAALDGRLIVQWDVSAENEYRVSTNLLSGSVH